MTPNRKFKIHSILVLSLLIFLFALAACEKSKPGYSFRGTLSPSDTGMLYLYYDTFSLKSNPRPFDSAVVRDGSFEFKGTVPYPMYCDLVQSNNVLITFIIENSDLILDTADNQYGYVVRGSKSNTEADEVMNLWFSYQQSQDTVLGELASVARVPRARRDSLLIAARNFDSLAEAAYYQKFTAYVKAHSTSYGALLGWQMADLWEVRSVASARRVFEQFDPSLRSSRRGKEVEQHIKFFESIQDGQPAPEINLVDPNGDLVSLSSYKGKRVLFFAYAFNKLPDEEFAILRNVKDTVVIAKDPDATWQGLKLVKVYESSGKNSPYLRYTTNPDPTVFLIDEKGKILRKGFGLQNLK